MEVVKTAEDLNCTLMSELDHCRLPEDREIPLS